MLNLKPNKMIKTNYRMIMVLDINDKPTIIFSDNLEHSHRSLLQQTYLLVPMRRFDVPVYGRFYACIRGNSAYTKLIIYGQSSDYPLEEMGHHQDIYEEKLREYAYENKMDIIFLP